MRVAIWDTYVQKKDGKTMHFDIVAPDTINDEKVIYEMGKQYLETKGQQGQELNAKQCAFCHQESATEEMEASITSKGYYIIEMEGCE
jgi:cytochrome c